jgi:hypothetical protein
MLLKHSTRFEVFMALKIQLVVFCVLTPHSEKVGHQRLGGTHCLHLLGCNAV